MKRIFVMTAMWVTLITLATAQPPSSSGQRQGRGFGTPEERAKNQTERLDKLVKLTSEQKSKMNAVNIDVSKKTDAAMKKAQGSQDRTAMRETMTELNAERDKQYKAILTEEQYKTYQEDNARREKERAERRGRQR